jgi:hypothetical protein
LFTFGVEHDIAWVNEAMELGKCEITFQRISQQFKRSGLGWGAFLETKVKVTEPR